MEAVGNASVLVVDWDNPELDDQRPHQRQVCEKLVPEIYRCLYFLWTLSDGKLGSFYSTLLVRYLTRVFARQTAVPEVGGSCSSAPQAPP